MMRTLQVGAMPGEVFTCWKKHVCFERCFLVSHSTQKYALFKTWACKSTLDKDIFTSKYCFRRRSTHESHPLDERTHYSKANIFIFKSWENDRFDLPDKLRTTTLDRAFVKSKQWCVISTWFIMCHVLDRGKNLDNKLLRVWSRYCSMHKYTDSPYTRLSYEGSLYFGKKVYTIRLVSKLHHLLKWTTLKRTCSKDRSEKYCTQMWVVIRNTSK